MLHTTERVVCSAASHCMVLHSVCRDRELKRQLRRNRGSSLALPVLEALPEPPEGRSDPPNRSLNKFRDPFGAKTVSSEALLAPKPASANHLNVQQNKDDPQTLVHSQGHVQQQVDNHKFTNKRLPNVRPLPGSRSATSRQTTQVSSSLFLTSVNED